MVSPPYDEQWPGHSTPVRLSCQPWRPSRRLRLASELSDLCFLGFDLFRHFVGVLAQGGDLGRELGSGFIQGVHFRPQRFKSVLPLALEAPYIELQLADGRQPFGFLGDLLDPLFGFFGDLFHPFFDLIKPATHSCTSCDPFGALRCEKNDIVTRPQPGGLGAFHCEPTRLGVKFTTPRPGDRRTAELGEAAQRLRGLWFPPLPSCLSRRPRESLPTRAEGC